LWGVFIVGFSIDFPDKRMLKTILLAGCIAVLVCWGIGAYNRLIRLRAAAKEAHKIWQNLVIQKQDSVGSEMQDAQLDVKIQMSKDAHDSASQHYNKSIKQFPASFIAALFSFQPYTQNTGKSE
jgi:hypothetical protein